MFKPFVSGLVISGLVVLSGSSWLDTRAIAQPEQSQFAWWDTLLNNFRRRPPVPRRSGGGRGDFDVIAPGLWAEPVLSTKPMVIWQHKGSVDKLPTQVEIVAVKSNRSWKQSVSPTPFLVTQIRTELEPGQQYRLRFLRGVVETTRPVEFRVLSEAERKPILQALKQTETQLRSQQATSREILNKRVEILANSKLWSDMLQEINLADLPAPERQQLTQTIVAQWYESLNGQ